MAVTNQLGSVSNFTVLQHYLQLQTAPVFLGKLGHSSTEHSFKPSRKMRIFSSLRKAAQPLLRVYI